MILTPPEFKNQIDGKLVFLAGPIQGALDWQKRAIELLLQDAPDLNIANPRGDYSNIKFDQKFRLAGNLII